jgi:hypothetical protein
MVSAVKTYFRAAWTCKTPLVFLLDKKYKIISVAILKEIAAQIKRRFRYIKDISDCDDAALLFKAAASERHENGVGLIFGNTPRGFHAWNVAMCPDGLFEVEPQTATIGKRKGYNPWIIVI